MLRLPHHPSCSVVLAFVALFSCSHRAACQVTLIGPHNFGTGNDGYQALNGSYIVPSDTSAGPSATFNFNTNGIRASNSTLTINGGQFDSNGVTGLLATSYSGVTVTNGDFSHNTDQGLRAYYFSTVTVTGGRFDGNGTGVSVEDGSTATISGGKFSDTRFGVVSVRSVVTVTGGRFDGNGTDFAVDSGGLDIYGQFDGLPLGQVQTLPNGIGTFTGMLENDATHKTTFTYESDFGSIRLHDVAPTELVPEPSTDATFTFFVVGMLGLLLRVRSRRQTSKQRGIILEAVWRPITETVAQAEGMTSLVRFLKRPTTVSS